MEAVQSAMLAVGPRTKFEHIASDKFTQQITRTYYTDASKQTIHATVISSATQYGNSQCRLFYPSMQVRAEYEINKHDDYCGRFLWYHENGKLFKQCYYVNGRKEGTEYIYGEDGKTVISSIQYMADVADGTYTTNYPNGRNRERANFTKGRPYSKYVCKYDNATSSTMIDCNFTFAGLLSQEFKVFSPNTTEFPVMSMYFNEAGEQTSKVTQLDEELPKECLEMIDKLLTIHEFHKLNKNVKAEPEKSTTNDLKGLGYQERDLYNRHGAPLDNMGLGAGSTSRYSHGSNWGGDWWKTSVVTAGDKEYEDALAKAIKDSAAEAEEATTTRVNVRDILDKYKADQVGLYKAGLTDHLAQLKECCAGFFAAEAPFYAAIENVG